jgi:hypothetical protein
VRNPSSSRVPQTASFARANLLDSPCTFAVFVASDACPASPRNSLIFKSYYNINKVSEYSITSFCRNTDSAPSPTPNAHLQASIAAVPVSPLFAILFSSFCRSPRKLATKDQKGGGRQSRSPFLGTGTFCSVCSAQKHLFMPHCRLHSASNCQ